MRTGERRVRGKVGSKPKYYGSAKKIMSGTQVCECGHHYGTHNGLRCCIPDCDCEVDSATVKSAIQAVAVALLRSPVNWRADHALSRIYGIIWGWSDEEWPEIARMWHWDQKGVEKIKKLHQAYQVAMRGTLHAD